MTPEQLDELEKLERAATPGPWEWDGLKYDAESYLRVPQGSFLGETLITLDDTYEGSGVDCLLLSKARNALPSLISLAREALELRERVKRLKAEKENLIVNHRTQVKRYQANCEHSWGDHDICEWCDKWREPREEKESES